MKILKIYLLVGLIALFFSCNANLTVNEEIGLKLKKVYVLDGKEINLKKELPVDFIEVTENNIKSLFNSNISRTLEDNSIINKSLDDMNDMYNTVKEKYDLPNIYNFESLLSSIKVDLVEYSDEYIEENIDYLIKIYQAQCIYLFIESLNEDNSISISRGGTYPGNLYSDEFFLLAANPWQIDCTRRASLDAMSYSQQQKKLITNDAYMDKNDAFRHSLWNGLLASYSGGDKAGRLSWAKRYTDAHESGAVKDGAQNLSQPLDNPMDYHNNSVGRTVWDSLASERQVWWWREVSPPSNSVLINTLYSKANNAYKFSTINELNNHVAELVYVY